MDSLYFLIPIAILLTIAAVSLYIWAVRSGQYEDLDNEASKLLFDELEENADDARTRHKG